jgi:hypothetical protein
MPTAQLVLSIRKRKTFVSLVMGQLGTLSLSWEKPPVRRKISGVYPLSDVLADTSDPRYNRPDFHPPHYG